MNKLSNRSLCAAVAISATFALGSTPAFAQEAAPSIQLPPTMPAPAAAPTIVLPSAPAAQVAPQAEAAPERAARTERAQPQRRAERPAAQTAASRVAAPSAPVSAAVPPMQTPAASAPVEIAPAPVAVPAAPQARPVPDNQPDSVRRDIDVPDEIVIASILGVLGLGIAGFVATRRRREDEHEEIHETAVIEEPVARIPAPLAMTPRAPEVDLSQARPPLSAATLAAGPVPTGEERQQLIEAMVASPPDSENPFTSRAARRKRARIILQARAHRQSQQPGDAFDWRTYKSQAATDPATSPLVDA
jgi:hypothetical protein